MYKMENEARLARQGSGDRRIPVWLHKIRDAEKKREAARRVRRRAPGGSPEAPSSLAQIILDILGQE